MKSGVSNAVLPLLLLASIGSAQDEDPCISSYPIKASKLRACPTAASFCSAFLGGLASSTTTSTTVTATTIYTSIETSYASTSTVLASAYTSTESVTTTVSGTACPLAQKRRSLARRQTDPEPSCGIAADADPIRVTGACNCILSSSTQVTVTGPPVVETVTASLVTCVTIPGVSTTTVTPVTCITSTSTAYDCGTTEASSSTAPSATQVATTSSIETSATSAEATLGTSTIPTDPNQPIPTTVSQFTCAEPQTCGNYILYPCEAPQNAGFYCSCGFDIEQNPTCFNGDRDCSLDLSTCSSNADCGEGFACITQTCCGGASCSPLDPTCPNLSTASRLFADGNVGVRLGGERVAVVEEVKARGPNRYWA